MSKSKQKEWQIEWLDVNSVTPYENNARRNDNTVPYLINSIKRFGFRVPLVIDKDSVVVCGHTRLKAALEIGMEKVPCVRASDLTKADYLKWVWNSPKNGQSPYSMFGGIVIPDGKDNDGNIIYKYIGEK